MCRGPHRIFWTPHYYLLSFTIQLRSNLRDAMTYPLESTMAPSIPYCQPCPQFDYWNQSRQLQIRPIQTFITRLRTLASRYEESYSMEMSIKLTRNRVLVALDNLIEVIRLVYDKHLAVQPIQRIMTYLIMRGIPATWWHMCYYPRTVTSVLSGL